MEAETNPSCNHGTLMREILSGCKVSVHLCCLNLAENDPEEAKYHLCLVTVFEGKNAKGIC